MRTHRRFLAVAVAAGALTLYPLTPSRGRSPTPRQRRSTAL